MYLCIESYSLLLHKRMDAIDEFSQFESNRMKQSELNWFWKVLGEGFFHIIFFKRMKFASPIQSFCSIFLLGFQGIRVFISEITEVVHDMDDWFRKNQCYTFSCGVQSCDFFLINLGSKNIRLMLKSDESTILWMHWSSLLNLWVQLKSRVL